MISILENNQQADGSVVVPKALRPFLGKHGHTAAQVDHMHAAWVKSCLLQVTLWSHPYIKDGDF